MARKWERLQLNEDRFFDSEPAVRRVARQLYEEVQDLPLVCPHGHVDPRLLADDLPFDEPVSLFLKPDHYILRMFYSQGVPLEDLGIPTRDGQPVETDPRVIWRRFAEFYHLFLGTPTRAWLDQELQEVFEVTYKLTPDSCDYIYDQVTERLLQPSFRPRALFDRFNIEVLTTTDGATDSLEHHRRIRESTWPGRVVPCFRPDAVMKLSSSGWRNQLLRLANLCHRKIESYPELLEGLEQRRLVFRELGAVATDHAVEVPRLGFLPEDRIESLFRKGLKGEATPEDEALFAGHLLMEMARMSQKDGLVMQLHPGSFRNHNRLVFDRFGPDMGADIPVSTEYTRNLRELLNQFGNDPGFHLVVFTLDESCYSRELAPLAGHYPAMYLGPAWWFFDSIEGMKRYRDLVMETAGVYNTAGFNDDTRAFLSIPARHDLCRRVDSNWAAGLVCRHILDLEDARRIMRALAYDQVKRVYRLQ